MPTPSAPRATTGSRGRRRDLVLLLLLCCLGGLLLGSLCIGRYPVRIADIPALLLHGPRLNAAVDPAWVVVVLVRLPRVLEAALCGMGLSLAGAAMQGVFRNPLVGPEICGVSAGAAFGGVLGIMLGWSDWGITSAAFCAAAMALGVAFGVNRLSGRGGVLALVLSGVIVGAFFSAAVGLMQYLAEPRARLPAITYWLLGSFAGADYQKLRVLAACVMLAAGVLLGLRWRLNLLSLGEDDAQALGVSTGVLRWACVGLVALIVAAQVAVSGGIGFVGLVIPHLARMLVGAEHGRLLPASMLAGGLFMLGLDDIARTAASAEIPIGLLTSFVGAPVFVVLFWRFQGRGWRDA